MDQEIQKNYWQGQGPYKVYMQDHSDYSFEDTVQFKPHGEFASYQEAVDFAIGKIIEFKDSIKDDPFSIWISPEPAGLHFDSHQFEDFLLAKLSSQG